MVWGRAQVRPYCPWKMVRRSGKGWLLWLAEAGYEPTRAQRGAAARQVVTGSVRHAREAKRPRSEKPCLNGCPGRPRLGNRFCERCHVNWGGAVQDVGVAG
jgi:hypothetical protein